jgi:SanA protein
MIRPVPARHPICCGVRCAASLLLAGLLLAAAANVWVIGTSAPHVHARLEAVPAADVGLVLGCSRERAGGGENAYFRYRVEAAAALYRAGRVRHLLVSGDNHVRTYNEPADLRDALMERGVPREAITLDHAGFRTLDSMARARAVVGLRRVVVISQSWHAARAVYLGRQHGLEVDAYCARDVRQRGWRTRQWMREALARAWMLLDVHVFHTRARFMGPYEPIQLAEA